MAFIANRRIGEGPPAASRTKLLVYFSCALLCLVVAITIMVIDPVQIIGEFNTVIKKNSLVYSLLDQDMDGVHVRAFLFNVTNAERFLSGEDKNLKVEEVGPFTYKEIRSQDDLVLREADHTMSYSPHTKTVFIPEESVSDPNETTVVMPNIAMLSMTSMVSTFPYFTRMGYNFLVNQINSRPFRTMTAYEYLWGYNEKLITLGNRFLPGWISFGKMGIMDRMYDNSVHYRIDLGAGHYDKFEIKAMNGYDRLTFWDDPENNTKSKCNSFENAYEGISYPSRMTPKHEVRIYRNVLCRFLELDYVESRTMQENSEGLVYRISNRTFTHNEDTMCLCRKGMCIEGMSDLSPCFYSLPLTLSAAHFTGANPKIYDRVEGLQPDEKRHESYFIIEPKLGIVLSTKFSVQVNIVVKDVSFNPAAKRFSNMNVPVGYFNIVQPPIREIDRHNLYMMYTLGPYTFLAVAIGLFVIAVALLTHWIRLLYWNWVCSQDKGMAFTYPEDTKPKTKTYMMTEMPLISK
ncbi:lysosome membrane protein 2-like [Plodia interpunctella]|uniref:lysosome membrane protein 2-like n=1 Tax=Plodia interpunctella TaxID=58824 RepID=UPI002367B447|nr:lysosome membrane protein 2-like [Plodia interpunctella]XP_053605700.1 lysosome membrane protein 2-like [Plodia interpunctella]XP_053605701.1 lysosome membrane protein 2-like [Plodia interpunctella]